MQKLPCEASPQGKMSISIPGFCNALLSNGGGLGRSLSYVGRSQISLFMMLPGSVVHKLPFAAASEAFAWNRRENIAFQSYLAAFAWNCRAKVASRAFACNCCARAALQNYFLSLCVELSCKSCVAELSSTSCMELCCKSCLLKLLRKVLHGIIVQGLSFEAIS